MDDKTKSLYRYSDICVLCGNKVPEGRMICSACEKSFYYSQSNILLSDLEADSKPSKSSCESKIYNIIKTALDSLFKKPTQFKDR